MNSNGPLTVSQLAGRFGSRNFTTEMRAASGGNEAGLKKFLLKYPSLFTVKGNMVSLFDGTSSGDPPEETTNGDTGSLSSPNTPTPILRGLPDVSMEMDAVQFFQNKLVKKEERWVQIRSLAGHLSQASADVRNVVGPQLDFRKWLLRHPHIFEVQGELVGLRDGIAAVSTPAMPRRATFGSDTARPPKTPPATRKFPPKTPPPIRRSQSFSEKRVMQQQLPLSPTSADPPVTFTEPVPPSTPIPRRRAPVTMTANEYKAVMFLKDIIEKRGTIKLHNITGHFSQAPEGVRNTIGWTKLELLEFLKKNAAVFTLSEDDVVDLVKNAKLNVIITGSRPQGQGVRTLSGRSGKIFHVAKLWGIIDLGKHEHVFFDKSIMKRQLDDMQKDFSVGEILSFNAVQAPKTSRAKWKATHVWKEHEQCPSESEFSLSSPNSLNAMSPSVSIEEEINRFLPKQIDYIEDAYIDASVSSAGCVKLWNVPSDEEALTTEVKSVSFSMVPEQYRITQEHKGKQMIAPDSAISNYDDVDIPVSKQNGLDNDTKILKEGRLNGVLSAPVSKYVDGSTQTVSTGDIIATQLYNVD